MELKRRQKWEYREREMLCETLAGWNETRTAYEGFIKNSCSQWGMIQLFHWRQKTEVCPVSQSANFPHKRSLIHLCFTLGTHTHTQRWFSGTPLITPLHSLIWWGLKDQIVVILIKWWAFFCQVKTAFINQRRSLFSLRGVHCLQWR